VLLEKWPRWVRWFFLLYGGAAGFIGVIVASTGEVQAGVGMLLVGALVATLFRLENRTVFDPARDEVVLRFRWLWHCSERRFPRTGIAAVCLRARGRRGARLGLSLVDGREIVLGQLMGYADDQDACAGGIAARLGVPAVHLPLSTAPATPGALVLANLICHTLAGALFFVAWVATTQPADDGRTHGLLGWIFGGLGLCLLVQCWYHTARDLRRGRQQRP
jgi:hypothetical protein